MKFLLIAASLALVARCQTPVPTLVKQSLPSVFLAGGEYSDGQSPKYSGFVSIALPVSTTVGLYSWSMYQGLIIKGKLTTSTTTGMADDLKTFCFKPGCAIVYALGAAGVATSSSTTLALADGGGLMWRSNGGWAFTLAGIENTAGGVTKPSIILGIGRTW
jgi:hypothetical protein